MQTNTTQGLSVRKSNHSTTSSPNYLFGDLYARYRLEKSFFGYDPSVLKSGIQKYAQAGRGR